MINMSKMNEYLGMLAKNANWGSNAAQEGSGERLGRPGVSEIHFLSWSGEALR